MCISLSLQIYHSLSTNSAIQISSPPVAAPHQPSRIGNQQMDANGTRAFMFCLIMFGRMLRVRDALAKVAYLILAWLRKTKYSWTYLPTHAIWQSQVAVCHNWPNNSNLIILWLLPVSVARRPLIFRVFFLWPTIRVLNPSFSCLPEKLFSEIPQRFDMVWQAVRTMIIQGVLGADLLFFGPLIVIFMMSSSMVMLFVPVVVMSLVRMQTLYYICSLSRRQSIQCQLFAVVDSHSLNPIHVAACSSPPRHLSRDSCMVFRHFKVNCNNSKYLLRWCLRLSLSFGTVDATCLCIASVA